MHTKLTINDWHDLSEDKKETLRKWAVEHNLGLDIIPSKSAATCDYAALLSEEHLQLLLKELNKKSNNSQNKIPNNFEHLWREITNLL